MASELTRLNEFSFERLVRALCFNTFGLGGAVFSPGPDGGRDFTVEGSIGGYEAKGWNGYLVVQCKFRRNVSGDHRDVSWLKKELEGERGRFADPSIGRRKPDYYIIVTNISLSGADGDSVVRGPRKGGLTKITDYLTSWRSSFGYKEFDVWGADKVLSLLEAQPTVRQTFAAWVTPGDVLTELLRKLSDDRPAFEQVIRRALKKDVRRDQYVRLKDGGSVNDPQVRTSQVFIDIPVELPDQDDETSDFFEEDHSLPGLVNALVERASEKLDPELLCRPIAAKEKSKNPDRNKIVLLGGPGQGKSTIGLFLSQIFRASILFDHPESMLDPNIRSLVPEILDRAKKEAINTQVPRRYPVHISLPRFADNLSAARAANRTLPSLLSFIRSEIGRSADETIEKRELRRWLSVYPWLVVLDGLDEVPPSGERTAVIEAISSFVSETVDAKADILIAVTTRPQGYNSDLAPTVWEHWRLADLPPERALAYAEALAEAQYPDDRDRRSEIHSRLREAAEKPATSRLMISPLQVTIMHLIVDTGGSIPAARWTLFNEYFEVLKRREKAKGGETQKILERNLSYLGAIHHRTGLALQSESEHAGSATSGLDHARFKQLLTEYLRSEGFENDDLEKRVSELMTVALHRLVLLNTRDEGRISFDVRSLQEYMAAAALTSGQPKAIQDRLGHIAGKIHWRHVFLIAASRCFAEDSFHYLRQSVVGIARRLEATATDLLAGNGARLALEMFIDGIGADHPIYRKQLAVHALELLTLGVDSLEDKLSVLWEPVTASMLLDQFRAKLQENSPPAQLAVLTILIKLSGLNDANLNALLASSWPADAELASAVLNRTSLPLPTEFLVEKAYQTITSQPAELAFRNLARFFSKLGRVTSDQKPDHSKLQRLSLIYPLIRHRRIRLLKGVGLQNIRAVYLRDAKGAGELLNANLEDTAWRDFLPCAKFCIEPSRQGLADALRALKWVPNDQRSPAQYLPWPIAALVASAVDQAQLDLLADAAQSGKFGDLEDWLEAERRWEKSGVTREDLLVGRSGTWFDHGVKDVGCPGIAITAPTYLRLGPAKSEVEAIVQLNNIAAELGNTRLEQQMLHLCHTAMSQYGRDGGTIPKNLQSDLISILERIVDRPLHIYAYVWLWNNAQDQIDFLNRLTSLAHRCPAYAVANSEIKISTILSAFARDESRRPLFYLIAAKLLSQDDAKSEVSLPMSALRYEANDTALTKLAIAILRLISEPERTEGVSELISAIAIEDSWNTELIVLLGDCDKISAQKKAEIFEQLVKSFTAKTGQSKFKAELQRWLDARPTQLNSRDIWHTLELPIDTFDALQARSPVIPVLLH